MLIFLEVPLALVVVTIYCIAMIWDAWRNSHLSLNEQIHVPVEELPARPIPRPASLFIDAL